jgi:mRNA-degrading endonuclease RelE of RelBE toxin-antitoxin system
MAGLGRAGHSQRILDRINDLQRDPSPNGDSKKRLKSYDGLLRLRIGDLRIVYRVLDDCVRIELVGTRKDVYRDLERLRIANDGIVNADEISLQESHLETRDPDRREAGSPQNDPELPARINESLLERLNIDHSFWPELLECRTLEDLCRANVSEDVRDWIFDCVCEPPSQWLKEEPAYIVDDGEDLRKLLDGELVHFLLRLDSNQNRVVEEFTERGGPALVTGGPGSGKSVVAVYAARSIVRSLLSNGKENPRVLVTTFTNALQNTIRQQLEAILGTDMRYVTVSTLDSVATRIAGSSRNRSNSGYRQHSNRDVELIRQRALEMVRSGAFAHRFDGVIIDEAQDLDNYALRLAIALSVDPRNILVTADADQSIYSGRVDVRTALNEKFRHWDLSTGHRSTRQIMDAARNYIGDAAPERPDISSTKVGHKPLHRIVKSPEDEVTLLVTYFGWATVQARTGYGTCAVLTRSNDAGRAIARRLRAEGVSATFMQGNQLDLSAQGIKVLTLHSAKGLEFNCVALAGFFDARPYGGPDSQVIHRNRRTMYVGMTRAVRSLLLIQPENDDRYEFEGIDPRFWNSRSYERPSGALEGSALSAES